MELHNVFRNDLIIKTQSIFEEYMGSDHGLLNIYDDISLFQKGKSLGLELNAEKGENVHINSSRNSCLKYEPALVNLNQDMVGCIKNHSELFCAHDSGILTKNIAKVAEKMGVVIEPNSEVSSFNIKDNKIVSLTLSDGRVIIGDKFVICSGVGSRKIGKTLG